MHSRTPGRIQRIVGRNIISL
ncbi:hypothetical protein Goklo_015643, partial [Gossypium klotzschianum]|nr:hypothetical protein [Gossypium klotzschianum]